MEADTTAISRVASVPAAGAGRARAVPSCWHRGPGTGTGSCCAWHWHGRGRARPDRFRTGPNRPVSVSVQPTWPIWKTIDQPPNKQGMDDDVRLSDQGLNIDKNN